MIQKFKSEYKGWYRFNLFLAVRFGIHLIYGLSVASESYQEPQRILFALSLLFLQFAAYFFIGNIIMFLFEKTPLKVFKNNFPKWYWFNFIWLIGGLDLLSKNIILSIFANRFGRIEEVVYFTNLAEKTAIDFAYSVIFFNVVLAPISILMKIVKKIWNKDIEKVE